MDRIKGNQHGFSAIETILVLVIVALISAVGFMVYKNQTKKSSDNLKPSTSNIETKPPAKVNDTQDDKEMTLASGTVSFRTPKSYTNGGIGCIKQSNAYSSQEYLDSTAILPGEKLTTTSGNGTEFFNINVCVFSNKDNLSPKVWFEDASQGGIGEGTGFPQDESSSADINGNAAFYRKTKPSYEEVNYVISAKDKLILVRAQTYDTDKNAPGVGDFRKFEPVIKDLVNSITVK